MRMRVINPWRVLGGGKIHTTYHGTVGFIDPPVQGLPFMPRRQRIMYQATLQAPLRRLLRQCRVRGVYYYPDPPRVPFTRPLSRSRTYFCPFWFPSDARRTVVSFEFQINQRMRRRSTQDLILLHNI